MDKHIKMESNQIVELNVGGIQYATSLKTLRGEEGSFFSDLFSSSEQIILRDSQNRIFIDRDGHLFRFVLDYLRTKQVCLPENFVEKQRLRLEAEFYRLKSMLRNMDEYLLYRQLSTDREMRPRKATTGYMIIGYRGTFAFGREGMSDVKFRKISRILVCGRIQLCKDVFGDSLNDSRDPDLGNTDRYSSRFYLKHTSLEQAFDTLNDHRFMLVGTAASGTNSPPGGADSEENRWLHYNEFVFLRA